MEPEPQPHRHQGLVTSASLTLAARIAAFGFSVITNVILARSLGPEGRGVYAVAVATGSIRKGDSVSLVPAMAAR